MLLMLLWILRSALKKHKLGLIYSLTCKDKLKLYVNLTFEQKISLSVERLIQNFYLTLAAT